MKKNQNRITEYRKMFQAWKQAGIVTYAGFIMGLPGDTPADASAATSRSSRRSCRSTSSNSPC